MSRNRRTAARLSWLICFYLMICMPMVLFAQESDLRESDPEGGSSGSESQIANARAGLEWSFDLSALMVSAAVAWSTGPNWRIGAGGGVGDDMFGFMAVGGYHYSEPDWWSYEDRDGWTDKALFDIFHAKVFARVEPFTRWQIDMGLHGSVFIHSDSSDDDFGSGSSVGAYVHPVYGWKHFKFGPRIMAGYFWGCYEASEFGVKVSPLILRITFG